MKKYTEKTYKRMSKCGFVIFRFKNICLSRRYPKGSFNKYIGEITDPFIGLLQGILLVAITPFELLFKIYSFIPKFRKITKNTDTEVKNI